MCIIFAQKRTYSAAASGLSSGGRPHEVLEELLVGFYHIDDVVGLFFALADEVDVENAQLVTVLSGIYILQVARLELVAVVVDLVLQIVAIGNLTLSETAVLLQQHLHIAERGVCERHHLRNVLHLFVRESLRAVLTFATERPRQMETAVADGFQFVHLT